MSSERFIQQATGYQGTPYRIARCRDRCGEDHVIIENRQPDGEAFWLDWIGAELADSPDEFDSLPFKGLRWRPVRAEELVLAGQTP